MHIIRTQFVFEHKPKLIVHAGNENLNIGINIAIDPMHKFEKLRIINRSETDDLGVRSQTFLEKVYG